MNIFSTIFYYANVGSWSRSRRFAVAVLAGVLVLGFGYEFDIVFLQRKLETLKRQNKDKKEFIQKEKQLLIQDQSYKNIGASQKPILRSGGNVEIFDVLHRIENGAVEAQIEIDLFEPKDLLQMQLVKLEIRGFYQNLLLFIDYILQQDFLAGIEELDLQKKPAIDGSLLDIKISLAVYKYLPNETTKKKNLSIGAAKRDIFKRSADKKGLHVWANKELRFLGLIKQGQTAFGVIVDPRGDVHRVVVGNALGLNQSKIIAIDESGIITTNKADNIYRK